MMKAFRIFSLLALLIWTGQVWGVSTQDIVIEARLFRGSRQAEPPGPNVVVSSFADPLMVTDDPAELRAEHGNIAAQRAELFDIYHLHSINHITTSRFIWDGIRNNLGGTISLDAHNYPLALYPTVLSDRAMRIRVEMSRFKARESSRSRNPLLNTEINLKFDQPVVLGFSLNGHSYFLSLNISRRNPESKAARVVPVYQTGDEFIPPPMPLQEVTPVYPDSLSKRGVEGTVILNLNIDIQGRVVKVNTLIATHPELENSAQAALKQWKYEPVLKNGHPISAVFAVAVDFRLKKENGTGNPPSQADPNLHNPDQYNPDPQLDRILTHCAEYCDRLSGSVLDFVCLEKVVEKISSYKSGVSYRRYVSRPDGSLRTYSGMNPIRTEKNTLIYDYQLVRKSGTVKETRTLIKENGKETRKENAPLKTKSFWYRHVVMGPIGLLCRAAQELHDYELVDQDKIKGEKTWVIKAIPKSGFKADHLFGKIWVRQSDYAILKIEWEQESLGNFEAAQKIARELRSRPQITLVSEYAFDKNGIRFPSLYSVKELYIHRRTGRRFLRSETKVEYDDYKFFMVDTEVKYK